MNMPAEILLNLQLFADGASGGEGGASAPAGESNGVSGVPTATTKGVKANPLADVRYGIQDDVHSTDAQTSNDSARVVETPIDRNAEFEKLIKGDYKDLYDARVSEIVQKRLKSTKETVDRYESLVPTLELLAKKYGVKDSSDIAALNKAIEEDDTFFEDEALERGLSVEQLKEIRKMEKENAELKRQMEEQASQERANQIYAGWLEQAKATQQIYPSFDLNTEMHNAQFANLLRSNIDVRTAYEVVHKDEIIPAAMQFTAKTVEQKLTNKILASGSRPSENGMNSASASVTKSDVSQLTKADRAEIIRRVQRGERIRF